MACAILKWLSSNEWNMPLQRRKQVINQQTDTVKQKGTIRLPAFDAFIITYIFIRLYTYNLQTFIRILTTRSPQNIYKQSINATK